MTATGQDGSWPVLTALRDVSFTYPGGNRPALDRVTLSVAPGEFLGVVGSNGSGKSTLALVLAGLVQPDDGTWSWQENGSREGSRNPDADAAAGTNAGIVFQDPDDQLVGSIVAEDVAFGPSCLGLEWPVMWQRVGAALLLAGADAFQYRAPHHLSLGERHRVAVADVLALHPRCLVLDEPTAMLDASARARLRRLVPDLLQRGTAVVWITHDLREVLGTDRLIVLHRGRIVFAAAPAELPTQPQRLLAWGLQPPPALDLSIALQAAGVSVSPTAHEASLLEDICRLWPTT